MSENANVYSQFREWLQKRESDETTSRAIQYLWNINRLSSKKDMVQISLRSLRKKHLIKSIPFAMNIDTKK